MKHRLFDVAFWTSPLPYEGASSGCRHASMCNRTTAAKLTKLLGGNVYSNDLSVHFYNIIPSNLEEELIGRGTLDE